jgi:hypothetical protein
LPFNLAVRALTHWQDEVSLVELFSWWTDLIETNSTEFVTISYALRQLWWQNEEVRKDRREREKERTDVHGHHGIHKGQDCSLNLWVLWERLIFVREKRGDSDLHVESINKNSKRFFVSNTSKVMKAHDSLYDPIIPTEGTHDSENLKDLNTNRVSQRERSEGEEKEGDFEGEGLVFES